jgi:hypothetical protein
MTCLVRIAKEHHDVIDLCNEELTRKTISTTQQIKQGRQVGSAIQRTCFTCRRYYKRPVETAFECSDYGTPLCRVDRRQLDPKRLCTCFHEHICSEIEGIRCSGQPKEQFPRALRIENWTDPRDKAEN